MYAVMYIICKYVYILKVITVYFIVFNLEKGKFLQCLLWYK